MLVHVRAWNIPGASSYAVSEEDEKELGLLRGTHTSQTPFEFLGFYVGFSYFLRFFRKKQRVPAVKADSSSALGAGMKLSSPRPAMNFVGAELALLFEREDFAELRSSHLPGKLNESADFLSRLMTKSPPPKPTSLSGVKIVTLEKRRGSSLKGFGSGYRPDLWGREASKKEEEPKVRRARLEEARSSWQ